MLAPTLPSLAAAATTTAVVTTTAAAAAVAAVVAAPSAAPAESGGPLRSGSHRTPSRVQPYPCPSARWAPTGGGPISGVVAGGAGAADKVCRRAQPK